MHAVVITAYKDFAMLEMLVDRLRQERFRVLIHIDARSNVPDDRVAALRAKGCFVSRRYRIFWGSYTHLLAVVELIAEALTDPRVEYLHVISGQDWPLMSGDAIRAACDGRIFMLCEPVAQVDPAVRAWFERTKLLHRFEHIHFVRRYLDKALFVLQRFRRRKRTSAAGYDAIHKGLVWVSLTAAAGRHVTQSERARRYLDELRTVYVPEEFFFQTVLMASPFAEAVVPDARRYMSWVFKHGTKPAVLDLDDLPALARSDAFFARKLSTEHSRTLIDRLAVRRCSSASVSDVREADPAPSEGF